MRNVTKDFRDQMEAGDRNFIVEIVITLKNGQVLNIDKTKIWDGGFSVTEATSSSNSFDIGGFITSKMTLKLSNIYGDFDGMKFDGAKVYIKKVGLYIKRRRQEETFSMGTFTVEKVDYNGTFISLTAYDATRAFTKKMFEDRASGYPYSLFDMIFSCIVQSGVSFNIDPQFNNYDYMVNEPIGDNKYTIADVVSMVLQIANRFLKTNTDGRLNMSWYGESRTEITGIKELNVDVQDITINAVTVYDREVGKDRGAFSYQLETTDDVYEVKVDRNALVCKGEAENVAKRIGRTILGTTFRPFSCKALSNPLFEAGDRVSFVDKKGKRYNSYITEATFTLGGYSSFKCSGKNVEANSVLQSDVTDYDKLIVKLDGTTELIEKERSDREDAISGVQDAIDAETTNRENAINVVQDAINAETTNRENEISAQQEALRKEIQDRTTALTTINSKVSDVETRISNETKAREADINAVNTALANSSGMYRTEYTDKDGSTYVYIHDKPDTETKPPFTNSKFVIEQSLKGLRFSKDGGKTWEKFAIDYYDATMIMDVIYANKLSADYIVGGTIDAENVNVINVVAKDIMANAVLTNKITCNDLVMKGGVLDIDQTGDNAIIRLARPDGYGGGNSVELLGGMIRGRTSTDISTETVYELTNDGLNFAVGESGEDAPFYSREGLDAKWVSVDTQPLPDALKLKAKSGYISAGKLEYGKSLSLSNVWSEANEFLVEVILPGNQVKVPIHFRFNTSINTGGYYYDETYNGSFAVKIDGTNKTIEFDGGWTKYRHGSTSDATRTLLSADVYYR